MPKSKHRRKGKLRSKKLILQKNSNSANMEENNSEVFLTKHPLSEIPHGEVKEALINAGKEAQEKFMGFEERVESLISRFDPFLILSVVSTFVLFSTLDNDGNPSGSINSMGLQQAHVELLQALILRLEFNPMNFETLLPQNTQDIFELLKELEETFTLSRFSQLETAEGDTDLGYLEFTERLRLHTQYVRNWGHYKEVVELLREIYSPLDAVYVKNTGLSPSEIINLFEHMMALIEDRYQSIFSALKRIFSCSTAEKMVRKYYQEFPDLKNLSKMVQMVKEQNLTKNQIMSMLLSHVELRYSSIFEFSVEQLAIDLDFKKENFIKFLSRVSLSNGEISDTDFAHIFLSNPIWEKPIMKFFENKFYCAIPSMFFGFSHYIFYDLLSDDKANREALERRRADFLEEKVEELFSTAFPDALIISGKKWKLNNVGYETDLLVKIDSHLIIIEAKSGKIPWAALRGGIKSAKTRIKKLIVEPAIQASRLEEAIIDAQTTQKEDFQIDLPFKLNEIQSIIKLAVTLEDFATIQSNTASLVKAGVMNADAPIIPTMAIADLKVVLELLGNEADRIHYLSRRGEIQNSVHYVGDELDLLSYYFKKGFVFGKLEKSGTILNLLPMSKPIDDYYQSLEKGGNLVKPKRILTKWYEDICQFLLIRKKPGWTEIATIILGMDFDEQNSMETQFKRICKRLKKQKRYKEGQLDVVMHIPAETRKYGVVYVTFFEENRKRRHTIMENASVSAFEETPIERCLVIARDLNGKDYPYTAIAIYDREERVMNC